MVRRDGMARASVLPPQTTLGELVGPEEGAGLRILTIDPAIPAILDSRTLPPSSNVDDIAIAPELLPNSVHEPVRCDVCVRPVARLGCSKSDRIRTNATVLEPVP